MKRTRIVSTPALGIVRQRTGEDAPEGAASDLVNMRLKDGALRPVGDAEQLTTLPANASAQAVLFHSALPDGEYLYRVGTIVYHRKATGDVAVMDFAGESFVSWKAFGTALIVVTRKYTRVAVLKDGVWVCIPAISDEGIIITYNPNKDRSPARRYDISVGSDTSIVSDKSWSQWYKAVSDYKLKGLMHTTSYIVAAIKLSDGSLIYCTSPTYYQCGVWDCSVDNNVGIYLTPYTNYQRFSDNIASKDYRNKPLMTNYDYPNASYITGIVFAKPNLTINLNSELVLYINTLRNLGLISSISVYSTKTKVLFDFVKSSKVADEQKTDAIDIFDLCFPEQPGSAWGSETPKSRVWYPELSEIDVAGPYFLLKEIPIVGDISAEIVVDIKPDDFEDIETRETIKANGSRHIIRAYRSITEYNSRLHICGVSTTLSNGDSLKTNETYNYTPYSNSGITAYLETTIHFDGINHVVKKDIPINTVLFRKGDGTSADTKFAIILPPIVAYPDARATIMRLILVNGSGSHFEAMSIQLKACLEGNFAYAKGTNTDINVTQPPFFKGIEPKLTPRWDENLQVEVAEWVFSSDSLPTIPNPPAESREFTQTNRLQVYNYGSPLTYELKNSYRFGASTERLLRCEAAVDQLSEGRFGQFPLYCFTDCGLYALEQGNGEVLYATSHPISADGLISPDGVTPIRGGVAFITSKGVMFVSGRQVIELSAPIRGEAEYYDAATGLPDAFRFIDVSAALGGPREPSLRDYLAGAELHHLYNEAELIAYNKSYAYAFVYGLDSKMWYRRQLPYANIQRAGTSLLCYNINGTSLYRANMEREAKTCGKPMLYVSRPLEMGSTAYKKLEAAIVRMDATSGGMVRAYLLGSADGVSYGVIQGASAITKENTIHDLRLGRSGVSVRSVVVALLFEANMRTAVQRFDFELEDRFTSRLR